MSTTTPSAAEHDLSPAPRQLSGLSIVLPCYDEEPNVAAAIEQARTAALRCAADHEIIVVDDGSRDGTRDVAELIAKTDPRVRVVAHEQNRGYGAALRSGFAASHEPWVLLTDGDLQFDLGDLDGMLPLTADHDLVAGYRLGRADPPHRRLFAHLWNGLVQRSFGVGVRDVDCAFKLMRGDALRALPLQSDGAMVSTELLVHAQLAGWRIAEVGVRHRARHAGRPTGGDPRVVLRALRERRTLARRLRAEAAGDATWRSPRPSTG